MLSKNGLTSNKIKYLSFVLAIGIVVRHSINIDIYGIESGLLFWIELFLKEVTDTIVPIFFGISGFLFFHNYGWNNILAKWKTRFSSLFVPYLLWSTIAFLYYLILFSIPTIAQYIKQGPIEWTVSSIIKDIVLATYNGPLWFLQVLIVYVLLGPIYFFFLKRKVSGAFLIAVIIGFNFILSNESDAVSTLVTYMLPYLVGGYCGVHYEDYVDMRYKNSTVLLAIILFIFSTLIGMFLPDNFGKWYIIVRTLQVISAWIFSEYLANERRPKRWMELSFFIFCSHSIILESIEKLLLLVLGKNSIAAMIDLIVAPFITIIIILILAYILKKSHNIWRLLTGNRVNG